MSASATVTTLAGRALALEDVAAVGAVDAAALRTRELIDVLVLIGTRQHGIPDHDLTVPVHVPNAGGGFCLHTHFLSHLLKDRSVKDGRQNSGPLATGLYSRSSKSS